jgi:hypothetical protein
MKLYKRTTMTWKIFEALFLNSSTRFGGKSTETGEWLEFSVETKGKAINLTQGVNACNKQYLKESGIPLNMSDISARPVEKPDGSWVVAMGESFAHRARRNAGLEKGLESFLEKHTGTGAGTPAQAPRPSAYTAEQLVLQASLGEGHTKVNTKLEKDPDDPTGAKKQARDDALLERMLLGGKT